MRNVHRLTIQWVQGTTEHQNNAASQKIECLSRVVRKLSEIRRCLYSLLEEGASTGLPGFRSCQGFDLDSKLMSMSLASGFSWSSFYLASLRSCFCFSGPKLDLSTLKPKYDSDTCISGFNICFCVLFCLSQRLTQLCLNFDHESICCLGQDILQEMDLGLFQEQARQAPALTPWEHSYHCYYTTSFRATDDNSRICLDFKNSLVRASKLGL